MNTARILTAVIVLVLFGGCQLVPTTRNSESAVKAADKISSEQNLTIRRVIEGERQAAPVTPPSVTVSGSSNQVEIAVNPPKIGSVLSTPYRETLDVGSTIGQTAASTDTAGSRSSVRIPLGVSLGLLAIGITALVFAVRYAITSAKRSSAAVGAVIDRIDSEVAARIRNRRSTAASTTDPNELSWLNAEIAEEEGLRGRLSALRHKVITP